MGVSLSCPITTMHVERHHTPIFNAACAHVHGWRLTQEDAHNIIEAINPSGIMLFGVYDGHGGSLASQYLKEAIPQAFKTITSLSDQNKITNLMLDLDAEFIAKKHQDGTTCCIVLAQLWDTIADVPIAMPFDEYFIKINYNIDHLQKNTAIRLLSVNIGDSRAMVVTSNAIYQSPTSSSSTSTSLTPSSSTTTTTTPSTTTTSSSSSTTTTTTTTTGTTPNTTTTIGGRIISTKKRANYVAITRDHKPQSEGERQRIINALGTVTGNRVDGSLALSRAIGDEPYKNNAELSPQQQKVIAVPDYEIHTIYWGDVLLVCCDGLFEADRMTYSELSKIVCKSIQDMVNVHKFIVPAATLLDNDTTTSINTDGERTPTLTPALSTELSPLHHTTSTSQPNTTNLTISTTALTNDYQDDTFSYEYADWDPAIVARDLIEQSLLAESKDNHTAIVLSFKLPKLLPNPTQHTQASLTSSSTTQNESTSSSSLTTTLTTTSSTTLSSQTTMTMDETTIITDSSYDFSSTPMHTNLTNVFLPSLLDYLPSKECIPGPYTAFANREPQWGDVYLNDLRHNGYTLDDVKPILDIVDNVVAQYSRDNYEPMKSNEVTLKVIEAMNAKQMEKNNIIKQQLLSSTSPNTTIDQQLAIVAPILIKNHFFKQQQDTPQSANLDMVFHHILRSAAASKKDNILNSQPKPF